MDFLELLMSVWDDILIYALIMSAIVGLWLLCLWGGLCLLFRLYKSDIQTALTKARDWIKQ